jgi:zinc D-Ala-D-Ala carboxypeptidase
MATEMLSPHFSYDELVLSQTACREGLDNTPDEAAHDNLVLLCEVLEKVRTLLNSLPILISSGYRSPEVNAACGGSDSSAHMQGLAADFTCPGYGTPYEICMKLSPYIVELQIDQLIHEYEGWVHLGLTEGTPRNMALTINESGTTTGFA